MLQILFKNITEEYLFEEYILEESLLFNMELMLGSNKSSPCLSNCLKYLKELQNPNSVVVHAVIVIEYRTRFCVCCVIL